MSEEEKIIKSLTVNGTKYQMLGQVRTATSGKLSALPQGGNLELSSFFGKENPQISSAIYEQVSAYSAIPSQVQGISSQVSSVEVQMSSIMNDMSSKADISDVLDALAIIARYGYKSLSSGNTLDVISLNRIPELSAEQVCQLSVPYVLPNQVVEWQMLVDLTNLSSSETPPTIDVIPPEGIEFNQINVDGSTEIASGSMYWIVTEAFPGTTSGIYDTITTIRKLNEGEDE